MSTLNQPLVWVDLEMTGLDPRKDVILEIAVIVTDGSLNTIIDGPELVVSATPEQMGTMDPLVAEMHAASGLDKLVAEAILTVGEAEARVMDWLKEHVPESGLAPLAGNSVHTDRAFMAIYMPTFEAYVHYRNIDVSTIKELAKRWYPEYPNVAKDTESQHRALSDIRASIDELRQYRDQLFVPIALTDSSAATP